jgi:hypothetical protein
MKKYYSFLFSTPKSWKQVLMTIFTMVVGLQILNAQTYDTTLTTAAGITLWEMEDQYINDAELDFLGSNYDDAYDDVLWYEINTISGTLTDSWSYHFSPTLGVAIKKIVITNTGSTSGSYDLIMDDNNLGSDGDTYWHYSDTNGPTYYTVSSDEDLPTVDGGDPVVSFLWGNEELDQLGVSRQFSFEEEDDYIDFYVNGISIPANSSQIFLILAGLGNIDDSTSNRPDSAFNAVQILMDEDNWPADFTSFLSNTEKAQVVNWNLYSVDISETTPLLCNGDNNGVLSAIGFGGTAPYTYSWSTGATTASISGLSAGVYTVTLTDASAYTASSSYTITEPTALISMVNIDSNVLCNGGNNAGATATVTGGTAPYVYAWSTTATTASITGIAAGTYTVTITDSNGCTSTANDSVSEPMALMAMITVDSNVSCNSGSDAGLTVMATGGTPGYAYTWNNALTAASITGLSAGVYEVTITDTNNCMVSVTDTTTEPTALSIGLTMDASVACFGASDGAASAVVAGGTMPYVYAWSNGDITLSTMGLAAGTYSIVATDSNGCMIMDSIMIAGPASAMTVVVNETAGIVCDGDATGALEATANGGWGVYSFEWNTTATNASISGLTEGSYTVNVTDSLGCLETASESIVHQFELPVVNLGADTTICNDASIELNAGNDGAAYAWSTTESAQTIVVSDSGSYSVVVTDANGCAGSDEIVISLDDCTGINELGTELSLMVYPNPSRGVFQIESNGFNLNESTVTIIDLRGNVVSTIRPQGAVRETITLNQPSGVYFLSIEVDGNVAQQRIIIQ